MKKLHICIMLAVLLMTSACGLVPSTNNDDDACAHEDCVNTCTNPGDLYNNGAFCVDDNCYCCYSQCGVDPGTGNASDCYCMTCAQGCPTSGGDFSCYEAENVCLWNYP